MSRASLTCALLAMALPVAAGAGAQELEFGSIAVVPFGAATRDPASLESARVLARSVEEALRESGRFMAVLERSPALDAAIQAELDAAQGPASFESVIQISTESQMNARFLMDGFVEGHEVTQRRVDSGDTFYDAKVRLRIRIVDVETRAMVLSEALDITNQHLDTRVEREGGGVVGFLKRTVSEAVGSSDRSPEDALTHVHENAADAILDFLRAEVSLLLVDYELDANDAISELVMLAAPDVEVGSPLHIGQRRRNRIGGGYRTHQIGAAEVTRIEEGHAFARITEGLEDVTAAIGEDPLAVIVRPTGD